MKLNLALILLTFAIALSSYQPAQARANNFTAKSVANGDNLLSILRQHGFTEKDREKVLASDARLRSLFLTLDTRYLVKKSMEGVEVRIYDSQTLSAFRIVKKKSGVRVMDYNPDFHVTLARVDGRVYGSLLGSVLGKIKSNWVASRFVDAYAFNLTTVNQVPSGARFWLNVEKKYDLGHFVKFGEVMQTSLEINGRAIQKRFVKYKNGGVFFAAQDLLESRPFYAPVEYLKIASRFSPNRLHPITKKRQPHLGVDFELPVGEPIFSPRKGTVLRYGRNHAAGNFIVLLHAKGLETSYNHLSKIEKNIRQGLTLPAGAKLGEVGCTGYCTRAHLHFAVKKNGRMVDPMKIIKSFPRQMERVLQERVASN